jgi:hypothetical protein
VKQNRSNSVPNHFAEEKTTRNPIPLRNFVPQHFAEENMLAILFAVTGNFCFKSFPKRGSRKF